MQLKFFTFPIILLVFLNSCTKPATNQTSNAIDSTLLTNDTLSIAQEDANIIAFKEFIHKLDSTDKQSLQLSTLEFQRIFANKSTGLCDTAYEVYQQFIDTLELKLNEKLEQDSIDYLPLFSNAVVPKKLKDANSELLRSGFKFAQSEGMVYIEQDRNYVIRNLFSFFSEPMKAYLTQIEKENREGFMDDAGIVITPKQHVDRIIWYEKFMAENTDFVMNKNCKAYKKAYLTYLLTGIDNTQLFENKEQMMLNPYFKKAFSYLLKTYPESETAMLVQPFKSAIEQKQMAVVDDLIKKYTIKGLIFSQY